jgi:hypothetical protein
MHDFIERVLASGVLSPSMVELPSPATSRDIGEAESRLGLRLPPALRVILEKWNGANLDVIRFVSCDLLEIQEHGLYFANDFSGFMYFLDSQGSVVSLDTDGGDVKVVAADLADLLTGYLFGSRASEFMGPEWLNELKAAGLAT